MLRDIPLKSSTLEALKQGLRAVVKTGTASRVLNLPDLPEIAGKTGTAQTKKTWFIKIKSRMVHRLRAV